ncbi:MAG TPA: hypothetical protein ENI13_01045, partial [candidate division CPR3 bacterium]|nr:hypothetical protein [candidate division CPR3 bacterium]
MAETALEPGQFINNPLLEDAVETVTNPIAPTQPVQIVSSEAGMETTQRNLDSLSTIEQQLAQAREQSLAIQQGVSTFGEAKKGGLDITPETTVPQAQQFLNLGGSPAGGAATDNVNKGVEEGLLTPEDEQALREKEAAALAAIDAASGAKDDPTGLNATVKAAQDAIKAYQDSLAEFNANLATARAERARLSIPGQREIEVRRQLNEVRAQADAFNLQTEQDKFREFEGQTLGFAGGRATEIDIRASFKRQELALKEKNLLAELGLEQELRGFELKTVEQQIDDFATDSELRNAVQKAITDIQQDVLDRVEKLSDDAKDTLGDILDNLPGFAFEDLSPEGQEQINKLVNAIPELTIDIVKDALKAQKAEEIFERGIKERTRETAEEQARISAAREVRLSEDAGKEEEDIFGATTENPGGYT